MMAQTFEIVFAEKQKAGFNRLDNVYDAQAVSYILTTKLLRDQKEKLFLCLQNLDMVSKAGVSNIFFYTTNFFERLESEIHYIHYWDTLYFLYIFSYALFTVTFKNKKLM